MAEADIHFNEACTVVMCAGYGSRLVDITHNREPKHLLPITRNSALLDFSVITARQASIKNLILAASRHTVDSIRNHSALDWNIYGNPTFMVVDEPVDYLETLKAIREKHDYQGPLIILNGDEVYHNVDLKEVYRWHRDRGYPITTLVTDHPGSINYPMWLDKNNRVATLRYPTGANNLTRYTHGGIWIIDTSTFPLMSAHKRWDKFLLSCIERGELFGCPSHAVIYNVNTPEDLQYVRRQFGKL